MTRNPNEIEQAVSRTLRDSLEGLQRTAEDLNHAVSDLVSACSSTRPANSLPPMIRAQSAAASLAATLEVLSRFVSAALQPDLRTPTEQQAVEALEPASLVERSSLEAAREPAPEISQPVSYQPEETVVELAASNVTDEAAPAVDLAEAKKEEVGEEIVVEEGAPTMNLAPTMGLTEVIVSSDSVSAPEVPQGFDVSALRLEERELHRRADRVAKVAMQDIKMLHPDQVRLGKEHKDLCLRLRGDIEKAHKEYDRRFHTILDHPVDYFYNRMVEILGDGDVQALGEYPYPSPVLRR